MDLIKKKHELIKLVSEYLEDRVSSEDLQKFSWEMIHHFSKNNKSELPPYQDFEREFWYTIWQVQHLLDEEHEDVTKKTLSDALEYLTNQKKMPEAFMGMRP